MVPARRPHRVHLHALLGEEVGLDPSSRPSYHDNASSQPSIAISSVIISSLVGHWLPAIDAVFTMAPPSGMRSRSLLGQPVAARGRSPLNTVSDGSVSATPTLLNSTSTGPSTATIAASTAFTSERSVGRKFWCGPDGDFDVEDGHGRRAELGEEVKQRGADAGGAAGDDDALVLVAEGVFCMRILLGFEVNLNQTPSRGLAPEPAGAVYGIGVELGDDVLTKEADGRPAPPPAWPRPDRRRSGQRPRRPTPGRPSAGVVGVAERCPDSRTTARASSAVGSGSRSGHVGPCRVREGVVVAEHVAPR